MVTKLKFLVSNPVFVSPQLFCEEGGHPGIIEVSSYQEPVEHGSISEVLGRDELLSEIVGH